MPTSKVAWSMPFVGLLVALLIGATTAEASSNCSLATLNGTYGVLEQGTVVGQIPGLPPPPFPVALTANPTFDGAGNLSGTYSASFGGVPVRGTFRGTYTVNSNCTYSDEFTPSGGPVFHRAGTITGCGIFREVHYVSTDPWLVAFGAAKKTPPGGCSSASLKGTYARLGHGTITEQLPGFPPPPLPTAHSGVVAFDGKESLSGSDTISLSGIPGPLSDTFTGTYKVEPDCTTSAVFNTSGGLVLHEAGTITGAGIFREVSAIITDAGGVSTDTLNKH